MKNLLFKIILLQIVLFFGYAMTSHARNDVDRNPQNQKHEERTITEFHSLQVSGLAVVYYAPGETTTARVEVSGMPIDDLITRSENGVLTITTRGTHNGEKIKVFVSSPSLKYIEVGGNAILKTEDAIQGNTLKVTVQSNGSADIDVNVKNLEIETIEAGDLFIRGVTQSQKVISVAQSGTLDKDKLVVANEVK